MKRQLQELRTPWGTADHVEDVGQGIKQVDTPSHGGLYVPSNLVSKIAPEGRAYAKKWSGSENWYEEDIGWAFVWVAFPELFRNAYHAGENMAAAKDIVKRYSKGGERYQESVQAKVSRIVREELNRLLTEDDFENASISPYDLALTMVGKNTDKVKDAVRRGEYDAALKRGGHGDAEWLKALKVLAGHR